MRRLLLAAALSFSVGSAAVAEDKAAEATAFVSDLADRVAAAAIKSQDAAADEIRADFKSLLDDGFDVPVIAQFVVGRYWRRSTEEERERFLELFQDMIVQTYTSQITSFGGEGISVVSTRVDNPKIAVVTTEIDRGDAAEPFELGWRVRTTGEMRIIDVIVEGVSLAQTQRSEYASVMRNSGGLSGLNEALEKQLAKLDVGGDDEVETEADAATETEAEADDVSEEEEEESAAATAG